MWCIVNKLHVLHEKNRDKKVNSLRRLTVSGELKRMFVPPLKTGVS